MSTPAINWIWRWVIFAGVVLGAGTLVVSAARHALAAHWAASSNPQMRLRAAASEPENADLWYQLGRYRQLDFEHSDLPLAISYYQRATSLNPGSPSYWMDLAGAYETAGDASKAEQAFREAHRLYPISAEAAWRLGNFLLRQGRVPEAFQQIHDAVTVDPRLTALAVSLCWRSTQNIDQILKTVLPDAQDDNWGAMQFFVEVREPMPAMAVWKRIAAHHAPLAIMQAFPLLDMLIETGHAEDAQSVWTQALSAAGIPVTTEPGGSLIWNGGFEQELFNGGFDWRFGPIEGAKIGWDEQIVRSGRRSLRVDFDGTANIDFQNLSQYVRVQPATPYRFTAFFRAEELSTENGIRFEIRDVSHPGNPARFTPNVAGTQPWAEKEAEFVTGADTELLQVVLRRTRSEKLGNKIRGTAWVDDVALVPLPALARTPQ